MPTYKKIIRLYKIYIRYIAFSSLAFGVLCFILTLIAIPFISADTGIALKETLIFVAAVAILISIAAWSLILADWLSKTAFVNSLVDSIVAFIRSLPSLILIIAASAGVIFGIVFLPLQTIAVVSILILIAVLRR
ncbi:MAG: hypothetical protein ACQ9ET_05760 [Nitrosomonadaceae bacterium]